jgi:hypothetical protein
MWPSILRYRMSLHDLMQYIRAGRESIREQSMKLDALWGLDKKQTNNLPL